jgi:hypothetical protein
MTQPAAREVAREFWRLMGTNDFRSVVTILAEQFVLEWPQTKERVRGAENFARMNEEYPAHGPWRFTINRSPGRRSRLFRDSHQGRAWLFSPAAWPANPGATCVWSPTRSLSRIPRTRISTCPRNEEKPSLGSSSKPVLSFAGRASLTVDTDSGFTIRHPKSQSATPRKSTSLPGVIVFCGRRSRLNNPLAVLPLHKV